MRTDCLDKKKKDYPAHQQPTLSGDTCCHLLFLKREMRDALRGRGRKDVTMGVYQAKGTRESRNGRCGTCCIGPRAERIAGDVCP